jgi:cold shock CspA family protein
MRTHGTLVKWNDDRGFGFVALPQSHEEVFVHISAFPKDGVRPRIGEIVSFEIRTGHDGRKRAEAVERPRNSRKVPERRRAAPRSRSKVLRSLLSGAVVLVVSFVTYQRFQGNRDSLGLRSVLPAVEQTSEAFACDGRKYCSEMTSCAEARYFLKHCPGVQMDGDGDGRPCERRCY